MEDVQDQLIPSLAINDRWLSHACVTASDEFGYGVFSWHSSSRDALHNAKLTGGKLVRVHRDADGEVMLPKEAAEALSLVIGTRSAAATDSTTFDAQALAVELFELQAQHNDGRGISCVRGVCSELERGQIDGARAIVNNESDKMRSYPDVVAVLKRVGFWEEIDWAKFGQ